ncbi:hypothetical protein Tco_0563866 [Tanacetum coccineum]
MAGEDEFHDDNPPPPPPPVTPTQQAPHTLSTIKLPILKKGEYDIWAMKLEHYLGHTDYPIWEIIQNGNGLLERERKARTTLLMAIPEDHLAKFHKMTDAKEMWEAIKSKFGGNDESKKMEKYILKQQFESFYGSNSEGLHKGYDRFQSLLSQLEIHGAGVSTEDANQKFLRSLPASWSQVSLIMRTKPRVDTLSFDDLYNNLRVFESDIKGSTASSSSTQNIAFVSSESTNSTNDVSTAYGVSTSSGHNLQKKDLHHTLMNSSYDFHKTEEVLQEDKEKAACISKGNQESRRRDAGNTGYKAKDNGRRPGKQEEPKALVTLDGEGVDWTGHAEDEQENFALMAYNNSGSDTEGDPQVALKDTEMEAHDVYYALKYDWKDLLHQTKSVKHIGKSKEVGTLRYLSLVAPLTKVGDEAVHKELGDRMERVVTTASSLKAEQNSDAQTRFEAASKNPMIHLSQKLTHLDVGEDSMKLMELMAHFWKGSEGFHQIIDFLNASHIQYALIENPTIYVSFIKQFWRTTTARTSATGEVELAAIIDGQEKTHLLTSLEDT